MRPQANRNLAAVWSSDFELNSGEWFGDWLHARIAEQLHIEQSGFMPDRVRYRVGPPAG